MKHTKLVLTVLFLMTLSTQLLGSFNNFEMDDYYLGVKTINSDAADIDHDGDLDFLTIQSYFSHMHLTQNNGANGLANNYITNYASDAKFIDFDGDGWDDMVYHYNYGTAGLYFKRNDQTGNFVQHSVLSTTDLGSNLAANGVATIAVGDYDADGDEDLLIGGGRHNTHVIVLQNDGNGGFTEVYTHPLSYDHTESRFADFDGDGDLDFMMLTGKWYDYNSQPMVWENTGSGFQVAYTEPAPFMISATRDGDVADLDGDGDLDIVAAGPYSNGFSGVVIYENTGSFNFTVHQIYDQTGMTMGGVRVGDFDLDGDIDLVTSTGLAWDPAGHSLTILSNEGNLNFVQSWDGDEFDNNGYATVINSIAWVGDAEGDGDLEVMTGEYYNGYLHGFNSPPPPPPPTEQTFTILGANGSIGDIDPYTQASLDGGVTWQQAYLTGGHPWGLIPGTNSWVNFDPDDEVGLNTRTPYRIRFVVPEDFTDPSMVFEIKADNRALIWINDTFIDSIDGGGLSQTEGVTTTPADIVVSQALHTGLNEIRLTMVDWGGIVGFNYRIDVTMTSTEDISDAVLTPDEAAELNNPPLADAGPDQAINVASVNLDGSGSSDPDGNLLSYSWSKNGNVIATEVNPTVTLADGSHTITLTVSDGELSATDQMVVDVVTNVAPIADAGDNQSIDCVISNVDVTLDGSGSSDADGDDLTYSWLLGGNEVSTDASFNTSLGNGSHTFTLTVSDGNASSSAEVTVSIAFDVVAPELTVPEAITVIANADGGYSGGIGTATASDVCDANVGITNDAPATFPLGQTTVTWTATDAAGNSAAGEQLVTVEAFPVVVDIKPDDDNNRVNPKNRGVIPVAVLTTDDFDALTIDVGSLSFGPGGTGAAHGGHSEDVDGDGDLDLMLHFSTQGSGVSKGDTELCLEGLTVDGVPVAGCDAINTTGGGRAKEMVEGATPGQFALQQNYPNPFNPTTSISYDIADAGLVRLTVYNLVGQEVAQLVNGHQSAGRYQISFDAGHMSNGMYFYILEAGEQRFINKMTLMK